MSLLELEDISTCYGDFQALFSVSLNVEAGESFGVIGANGAGKSTLLRTIAGLLESPTGSVRFDGEAVEHLPAHKRVSRGISLVPEGRRVFPSLTVHENLQVGAYGKREGPWSLDAVYDVFPLLVRLRNKQASYLSGGEQQALAIGRALMSNPRLLLIDEVSLGLAPVVIRHLYEALQDVVAGGLTVVLVEQDIGQILEVADRVCCLLEGRKVLEGPRGAVSRDQVSAAYFGVHDR
ncbi:MAG: ABC transporter ATP-binding protein [Thermoleophilia bacterium]